MPSIWNDIPNLQGPPDVTTALQMLSEGLQERRKQKAIDAIGSSIGQGDFQGAAQTAFASGDLSSGLKIHELGIEQKKQFAETVVRHISLATPETYPALRKKLIDLTGEDPGEDLDAAKADILGEYGNLETIMSEHEKGLDNARADEQLRISEEHLRIAQDKARQEASGGTNLFGGNGLDAQALNKLVANGTLTEAQALDVAAGKTITGPNGEIIFASPSALAGGQPGQAAAPNVPSGMTPLTAPRFTEDMKKVGGFARRAVASDEIISQADVSAAGQSLTEKGKSGVPVVGNYLVSEDYQKFDQARRDFVNALLRRESGAVISNEEFENANKQYFPQPGDSKAVLEQKAANRKNAIESLQQSAVPVETFPDLVAGPRKPDDVPAGVDPEDWRFMTEEERALWR